MKITRFTQGACRDVAEGAMAALEAYAASQGLAVERDGRGRFDLTSFSLKFKFVVGGQEGLEEKQKTEFTTYASMYGLEASDYNREFDYGRDRYRVVGFAHRRRKYPYECVEVRSGKTIFLPEMAKVFIERERAKAA